MSKRIVIIGDVVYDLLVHLSQPLHHNDDTHARMTPCPGGSGGNLAAWLARLKVETHLIGRVGDDIFGRAISENLQRDGVQTHFSTATSEPTGTIVVLVNTLGERSMIADRGANLSLSLDDLPLELFTPETHLHLSGYSFFTEQTRSVALSALHHARACGMSTSIDPSSASLLQECGPETFLEWTRGIDLIFPNLEEGRVLTSKARSELIIETLCQHYPGGVVLKLGPDGAMWGDPNGIMRRLPSLSTRVLDTTGAGDAVCASFLAAWVKGATPLEALQQGMALAAEVVGRLGSR